MRHQHVMDQNVEHVSSSNGSIGGPRSSSQYCRNCCRRQSPREEYLLDCIIGFLTSNTQETALYCNVVIAQLHPRRDYSQPDQARASESSKQASEYAS